LSGDYAWQEKACQNVQKVQGSISIMVVEHPSQVTQNVGTQFFSKYCTVQSETYGDKSL
jgi:hypothetical protein